MKRVSSSSQSVVSSKAEAQSKGATGRPSASIPHLAYHDGPVLGAVEVTPIYWGAAWTGDVQATLATKLNRFFDFILKSPLLDMLSEYSTPVTRIQHGHRLPSVHFSDSEPGTLTPSGRQLTDDDVQNALQGWIKSQTVPATTENTLYFIFLPPGVKSLGYYFQPSVDGTFYGYHGNAGKAYYVVVPYIEGTESVYPGTTLDTFTAVSSRELCSAIVNPALDGWFDPVNQEIGDVCNGQTARLGEYLVHLGWSNEQKACAFHPAGSAPGASKAEGAKGVKAQKFLQVPPRKSRKAHRTSDVFSHFEV